MNEHGITAESILENLGDLGSPPMIYHQIQEIMASSSASAIDISQVISTDASLSARLLRMANSALYGFPGKIEDINRAVTIIGTRQINDLATATAVIDQFSEVNSEHLDILEFWSHSIAVGCLSRTFAQERREANAEHFFLLGILHDIGRLILFIQEGEIIQNILDVLKGRPLSLTDIEHAVLGFTHADIGSLLLNDWGLPNSVHEAIASHHTPLAATSFQLDACLLHCADATINAIQIGSSGENLVPRIAPDAWEKLSLPTEKLSNFIKKTETEHTQIAELLLGDLS